MATEIQNQQASYNRDIGDDLVSFGFCNEDECILASMLSNNFNDIYEIIVKINLLQDLISIILTLQNNCNNITQCACCHIHDSTMELYQPSQENNFNLCHYPQHIILSTIQNLCTFLPESICNIIVNYSYLTDDWIEKYLIKQSYDIIDNEQININKIHGRLTKPSFPLLEAVRKCNDNDIDIILSHSRTNINLRYHRIYDWNISHLCPNQYIELFHQKGLDINQQDRHGNTALHNAVGSAEFERVNSLLHCHSIDIEIENNYGSKALDVGIKCMNEDFRWKTKQFKANCIRIINLLSKEKMCQNCGESSSLFCSGCKVVWYCCEECQSVHWTKKHRKNCKKWRK
eukprot:490426_1